MRSINYSSRKNYERRCNNGGRKEGNRQLVTPKLIWEIYLVLKFLLFININVFIINSIISMFWLSKYKTTLNELNILFQFIDIQTHSTNYLAEGIVYLFYSLSSISYPNSKNYTISFDESIIFPLWFINFRYLDKNLIRIVFPDINPDSFLAFENINYLRREEIPILDVILSDFSVDAYSKSQRSLPILIYPDYAISNSKCNLNKIKNVYKFIENISKNLIGEHLAIEICNWILEESDIIYLWQK